MNRNTGKRAQMRATTRQKILQVALQLFAERGYFGTSIDLIARHCQISKGLIYHYFQNKQEILVAILQAGIQTGHELLKGLDDIPDPYQQFAVMIERSFNEILRNQAYWRLYFHVLLQSMVLELFRDQLMKFYQEFTGYFRDLLKKMGVSNPDVETRLLIALLDGLGLHYILVGEDFPLAAVKNALIQRYARNVNPVSGGTNSG